MKSTICRLIAVTAWVLIAEVSVAQVSDCSVRRRAIASLWSRAESGEVVDQITDGLVNEDLGPLELLAAVTSEHATSTASHSMDITFSDGVVSAYGESLLNCELVEEVEFQGFRSEVLVDGYFTTESVAEIHYQGEASGDFIHMLSIQQLPGGVFVSVSFPSEMDEFSYEYLKLPPGEYFYQITHRLVGEEVGPLDRSYRCGFGFQVGPPGMTEESQPCWGLLKSMFR